MFLARNLIFTASPIKVWKPHKLKPLRSFTPLRVFSHRSIHQQIPLLQNKDKYEIAKLANENRALENLNTMLNHPQFMKNCTEFVNIQTKTARLEYYACVCVCLFLGFICVVVFVDFVKNALP